MGHTGSKEPMLLCDFGGTHGRMGLYNEGKIEHLKKYQLAEFDTHIDLLDIYKEQTNTSFSDIAIAAAGAHIRSDFPSGFRKDSKIDHAYFKKNSYNLIICMNDFEASAWGTLDRQKKHTILRKGQPDPDSLNELIIGPGTGLGCAYIQFFNNNRHILSTHGGHMRPCALTEEHYEILKELQHLKKQAVIYEDIVSGRGFELLYQLFRSDKLQNTHDILDAPHDPVNAKILKLFHEFLGLYIQNSAVSCNAYHHVYLTGGLLDIIYQYGLFKFDRVENMINQPYVDVVKQSLENMPVTYINDTYLAIYGLKQYLERQNNV